MFLRWCRILSIHSRFGTAWRVLSQTMFSPKKVITFVLFRLQAGQLRFQGWCKGKPQGNHLTLVVLLLCAGDFGKTYLLAGEQGFFGGCLVQTGSPPWWPGQPLDRNLPRKEFRLNLLGLSVHILEANIEITSCNI